MQLYSTFNSAKSANVSTLPLLVSWIRADNTNHAFTADHFAIVAHFLD